MEDCIDYYHLVKVQRFFWMAALTILIKVVVVKPQISLFFFRTGIFFFVRELLRGCSRSKGLAPACERVKFEDAAAFIMCRPPAARER